jgi:hypothetical protein
MVFNTPFQQYFSHWYLMAVCFIGGGNRSNGENHCPAAGHYQALSHHVVLSTPRHEPDVNSQL